MSIKGSGKIVVDGRGSFGLADFEVGFRAHSDEHEVFVVHWSYSRPYEGGSYTTSIPISSLSWRKDHMTKCGYRRTGSWTVMVQDDHGFQHFITLDDPTKIRELCVELERFEVPALPTKTED